MPLTTLLVTGLLIAGTPPPTTEPPPPPAPLNDQQVVAEQEISTDPNPLPPPECWWEAIPAGPGDRAREQNFWQQIDGGDHYDDVLVFLEDGTLQRTFISSQSTFVLQHRVCADPDDDRAGTQRWELVGPPNPAVYWDELTERVTRQVPLPDADLGFSLDDNGRVDIAVQMGLWISVSNHDDVVARAEPAAGVWAETRASLVRIEFDSGTGTTVTDGCEGAGTPIPDDNAILAQGGCGYTYTTFDELGEHTAVVRAIWSVVNTTSAGDVERRADIVAETPIPITVREIVTVGRG